MTFPAFCCFMNEVKKKKLQNGDRAEWKKRFRSWKATKPVSFLKTRSSQSRKVHIRKMKTIHTAKTMECLFTLHFTSHDKGTTLENNSALIFRVHRKAMREIPTVISWIIARKWQNQSQSLPNALGKSIRRSWCPLSELSDAIVCFETFFFDRSLLFWLLIIIISDCWISVCFRFECSRPHVARWTEVSLKFCVY